VREADHGSTAQACAAAQSLAGEYTPLDNKPPVLVIHYVLKLTAMQATEHLFPRSPGCVGDTQHEVVNTVHMGCVLPTYRGWMSSWPPPTWTAVMMSTRMMMTRRMQVGGCHGLSVSQGWVLSACLPGWTPGACSWQPCTAAMAGNFKLALLAQESSGQVVIRCWAAVISCHTCCITS
jgi:hypothetical protein